MSDFWNIDKLKGKVKVRVDRVGIELEGGWEKVPKFECGEEIIRDGSVKIDPVPLESQSNNRNEASGPPPFNFRTAVDELNAVSHPENRVHYVDGTARFVDGEQFDAQDFRNVRFQDIRGRHFGPGTSQEILRRVVDNYNGMRGYHSGDYREKKKFKQLHIGEVASPVLELGKVSDWMRLAYPQHVNHTCGLHVHMSFKKSLHYERLMVPEYQATVINYLSKWALENKIDKDHPIWNRLSGKNEFCKHEFFADVQARKNSKIYEHHGVGNRYTAINYCYGQHGTIECRVLPMFSSVEDGIAAVKEVISITNACIRYNTKKEESYSASVAEASIDRQVRREVI